MSPGVSIHRSPLPPVVTSVRVTTSENRIVPSGHERIPPTPPGRDEERTADVDQLLFALATRGFERLLPQIERLDVPVD